MSPQGCGSIRARSSSRCWSSFWLSLVLGALPIAVLAFEVVLNATSMFNHGNVRLPPRLDRVLRLLVVTPDMHRVHHSIDRRETDSNFGFNVPWWDRLFGTYRAQPALGHDRMTLGIDLFREQRELWLDRMLLSAAASRCPGNQRRLQPHHDPPCPADTHCARSSVGSWRRVGADASAHARCRIDRAGAARSRHLGTDRLHRDLCCRHGAVLLRRAAKPGRRCSVRTGLGHSVEPCGRHVRRDGGIPAGSHRCRRLGGAACRRTVAAAGRWCHRRGMALRGSHAPGATRSVQPAQLCARADRRSLCRSMF